MNLAASLLQLLPRLIAVYTRFLDLLHEEQAAFSQTRPDALEKCTSERVRLAGVLEAHDQELRALFANEKLHVSSRAVKQLINSLAEPQRSQLAKLWHQLLELAAECKKHNAINSKIIDTRRVQTDRVLRILMGQTAPAGSTYAADGRVQPGTASVTLATA